MKVIIIGAKGNLGYQLAKVFADGNEVISWDKEDIDVTDKDLIHKKIKELKPDLIVNAAAYNAVDKCEEDEEQFEIAKKINGLAVGYLADAALVVGAVLVHYSSDYVFDGKNELGYKEDDEPNPISKYAESKYLGERELISRSGKGLKWYIIRPSKLFGPKGESDVAKDNFFDLVLKLSKDKKVFNMVEGAEISSFTYTPDLAEATRRLVDDNMGYGIYHITNHGPASWYEAAKFLFEITNSNDVQLNPVSSKDYPRPAKRPRYSVLLSTKIEPLRDWREALREYLNK